MYDIIEAYILEDLKNKLKDMFAADPRLRPEGQPFEHAGKWHQVIYSVLHQQVIQVT